MRIEIKQRIEQIRRGEVPDGYKKSPFGILPNDWKIKKLSDVLKKQTQKNKDNSVHNVLTNSATQGIISQTDYFDKKIANDENTNGYYLVQPGNFVYNPRISNNAPCGPFNRYNGNQYGIMSPLYTVYSFTDKSLAYSDYLSQYFLSSKWHAYMNGIANYGARSDRMNVLSEDMDNMPLPYPPSCEVQRIVEILSMQDRVIELYEKKIEQLQLLKKVCLQKMFPKQGRNVPEVRFPGFTEPWEQHKLGELALSFEYGLNAAAKEFDGLNKYLRITDIDDFSHEFNDDDLSSPDTDLSTAQNYLLQEGDLLFARTGASVGKTYFYKKTDGHVYFAGFLIRARIKTKYDYNFIFQNTLTTRYEDYIKITSQRSGQPGINAKEYADYVLLIPEYAEQCKIGECLGQIDHLITLHQRRLDEENRKKKALMQLLLTGIVRV